MKLTPAQKNLLRLMAAGHVVQGASGWNILNNEGHIVRATSGDTVTALVRAELVQLEHFSAGSFYIFEITPAGQKLAESWPKRIAKLTEAEDALWQKYYAWYCNNGFEDSADAKTWADLQKAFPRLQRYDGCKP